MIKLDLQSRSYQDVMKIHHVMLTNRVVESKIRITADVDWSVNRQGVRPRGSVYIRTAGHCHGPSPKLRTNLIPKKHDASSISNLTDLTRHWRTWNYSSTNQADLKNSGRYFSDTGTQPEVELSKRSNLLRIHGYAFVNCFAEGTRIAWSTTDCVHEDLALSWQLSTCSNAYCCPWSRYATGVLRQSTSLSRGCTTWDHQLRTHSLAQTRWRSRVNIVSLSWKSDPRVVCSQSKLEANTLVPGQCWGRIQQSQILDSSKRARDSQSAEKQNEFPKSWEWVISDTRQTLRKLIRMLQTKTWSNTLVPGLHGAKGWHVDFAVFSRFRRNNFAAVVESRSRGRNYNISAATSSAVWYGTSSVQQWSMYSSRAKSKLLCTSSTLKTKASR